MPEQLRQCLPLMTLILGMALLQWIGPQALRYDTRLINDGQLWRLLSGHWVHANWVHYGMNMLGFLLCQALTGIGWNIWQWSWRILVLTAGVSGLFYGLEPDLGWYVGFSGVLFGLYVIAAVDTLRLQPVMSIVILAVILLKIILEQWSSVTITSADLIGVPVIVDAHLYGVSVAGIILLIQYLTKMFINLGNTGNT
ncbi:MAG: rhombosortase [Gammaproteobacteria bacterium]|nr:rhombosortase [Gammaproteobacteria bacterium]